MDILLFITPLTPVGENNLRVVVVLVAVVLVAVVVVNELIFFIGHDGSGDESITRSFDNKNDDQRKSVETMLNKVSNTSSFYEPATEELSGRCLW